MTRILKFGRLLWNALKSLGLILVITSLLLIGVEIIYRHRPHKTTSFNETIRFIVDEQHVPRPYVMFSAKPEASLSRPGFQGLSTNIFGYLTEKPDVEKRQDEIRIFLLGSSVLFTPSPGIAGKLEAKLNEAGQKRFKVFNLGIPSSVTRQDLVRLLLDVASYQPDIVISFAGYNDIYDTGWDRRINYPHRYGLFESNPMLNLNVADFPFFTNLLLSSQFARDLAPDLLYRLAFNKLPRISSEHRSENRELILKAYIQNLRLTAAVTKMLGAQFFGFLQPTVYFKKVLTTEEVEIVKGGDPQGVYQVIPQILKKEMKPFQKEFYFEDMSGFFSSEKGRIFHDWVHYEDERGNDLVADHLAAVIKSNFDQKNNPQPLLKNLFPEELFIEKL